MSKNLVLTTCNTKITQNLTLPRTFQGYNAFFCAEGRLESCYRGRLKPDVPCPDFFMKNKFLLIILKIKHLRFVALTFAAAHCHITIFNVFLNVQWNRKVLQ